MTIDAVMLEQHLAQYTFFNQSQIQLVSGQQQQQQQQQQQNAGLTRLVQLPPLSVNATLTQQTLGQTSPSGGVDLSSVSSQTLNIFCFSLCCLRLTTSLLQDVFHFSAPYDRTYS